MQKLHLVVLSASIRYEQPACALPAQCRHAVWMNVGEVDNGIGAGTNKDAQTMEDCGVGDGIKFNAEFRRSSPLPKPPT